MSIIKNQRNKKSIVIKIKEIEKNKPLGIVTIAIIPKTRYASFAKFSITILEELSPFQRRSVVVHVLCVQPRLADTIAESCFHLASLQVDD